MNLASILKWIVAHKTHIGTGILITCIFFIGRLSKFQEGSEGGARLKYQADSMRLVNHRLQAEKLIEASNRSKLEKLYRNKMRVYDSLKLSDQAVIKHYKGLIGKKQTPHELQAEMDSIYAASRRQR